MSVFKRSKAFYREDAKTAKRQKSRSRSIATELHGITRNEAEAEVEHGKKQKQKN